MHRRQVSAQRRRINAFALAWAKADMGPGYHAHGGMRCGMRAHVVADYALNWLAQHREMPTGVHQARASRPHPMMPYTQLPTLTVDYSGLTDLGAMRKLIDERHVHRIIPRISAEAQAAYRANLLKHYPDLAAEAE